MNAKIPIKIIVEAPIGTGANSIIALIRDAFVEVSQQHGEDYYVEPKIKHARSINFTVDLKAMEFLASKASVVIEHRSTFLPMVTSTDSPEQNYDAAMRIVE
jgi:hypothetical protein